MIILRNIIFTAFLLVCAVTVTVSAQVSLVPVHHPVYDWLYHQRVAGHLPYYAYESLPLQRAEVIGHLRDLQRQEVLRGNQRRTLERYLREFDLYNTTPASGHRSVVVQDTIDWPGGSIFERYGPIWSDNEKHLAVLKTPDTHVQLDGALGYRFFAVNDAGTRETMPVSLLTDARLIGSLRQSAGMHVEFNMAIPFGAQDIYRFDRYYTHNWVSQFSIDKGIYEGQTLMHFQGSGTVRPVKGLAFSIGRGNLKIGSGEVDNFLFSRNAYPLDWLRLDIGNHWFRYQGVHGTLSWPTQIIIQSEDPLIITRNSPQRFVRYHSVTMMPVHWFQVTGYEMMNYSNRGMEVAYLNPFNVLLLAERELQDQDNGMAGVILVLRPYRGIELYTELMMDDLLTVRDVFFKKQNPEVSRFGRRYALQWAPLPDWRVFTEYKRIDPFVYSHPYVLNSHTDKGVSLGSQLDPNSDRIMGGLQWMGIGNTRIGVHVSRVRQGRDIFDEDGNMIFSSGVNPTFGRIEGIEQGREADYDESYLFLDGDQHRWMEVQAFVSWEPRRGVTLSSRFDQRWMQQGEQVGNQSVFWMDMRVGF